MLSWIFRALRLGGVLTSIQATPLGLQMTPPSLPGTENPRKPGSPDFILIILHSNLLMTQRRFSVQESAEICTLKHSHAQQNSPTSLMISKRLVMVCVRQENSNTMFTILSLCLLSVNVLTALLMCRTWLIYVYFSSQKHDVFEITIFSFHYVLIWPTREQ